MKARNDMAKYIKLEDAIHNINLEVIGRKEYTGDMKANLFFALDELPTIEVDEDAISREGLSDKVGRYYAERGDFGSFECSWILNAIKTAPSVVPGRAEGEWKFKKIFPNDDSEFPMGYLVCSVCGSQHTNATPCNYCDNCGAKMKG